MISMFNRPHSQFSIHALLAESDVFTLRNFIDPLNFLSTLSLRRATLHRYCYTAGRGFSIHALLAESDRASQSYSLAMILFSIHALLAESDIVGPVTVVAQTLFYPRSPCGERRWARSRRRRSSIFYPRSPCGERQPSRLPANRQTIFYPRSPCGERPKTR